ARDQPLKSFIKVRGGNFVGEIAIGFRLELIHDNAEHAAAALVSAATGRFHHAEITAGTDGEAAVGEQLAHATCLLIFRIELATLGAAKNRYDAFGGFVSHNC